MEGKQRSDLEEVVATKGPQIEIIMMTTTIEANTYIAFTRFQALVQGYYYMCGVCIYSLLTIMLLATRSQS